MRTLGDWTTALGVLALACTLALLSPGVRSVRAADAPPEAGSESAPEPIACEAPRSKLQERVLINDLEMAQKRELARVAASVAAGAPGVDVETLDNGGYNYPSTP